MRKNEIMTLAIVNYSLTERGVVDILSVELGTLLGGVLSVQLEKEIKGRKKDTQVVRVSSRARKASGLDIL